MLTTPLKFIHIGFGNMLCANKATGIVPLGSATAKRLIKEAKESHHYLDMTSGHPAKCFIILDDGKLVGCGIRSITIVHRFNADKPSDDDSDDSDCCGNFDMENNMRELDNAH